MKGIIKHDWYSGLLGNWKQLFIISIVFYICGLAADAFANSFGVAPFSFMENWIYVMQGCAPCSQTMQTGAQFELPIIWMILQIFLAYIIGGYPLYDLQTYGINLMVRTKSRSKWWIGKVLWIMELVGVVYLLGVLMIAVVTLLSGGSVLLVRPEAAGVLKGDYSVFNGMGLALIGFILPMLSSIAISMIQLLLIFLCNHFAAYAVVFLFIILSVFYSGPIWIYENGMSIRSNAFVYDGSFVNRIIGLVVVIVVTSVAGCFVMKRRDIYGEV